MSIEINRATDLQFVKKSLLKNGEAHHTFQTAYKEQYFEFHPTVPKDYRMNRFANAPLTRSVKEAVEQSIGEGLRWLQGTENKDGSISIVQLTEDKDIEKWKKRVHRTNSAVRRDIDRSQSNNSI